MKRSFFFKELGQTSTEYLLLMCVSVGLGLTFMKKFEGYFLKNPDSFVNKQIQLHTKLFDASSGLKRYRLPR